MLIHYNFLVDGDDDDDGGNGGGDRKQLFSKHSGVAVTVEIF